MVSTRLRLGERGAGVVEVPADEQARVEGDDADGDVSDFFLVHSVILFIAFNRNRML